MSSLMGPGTHCVAATTGGAGKFRDSALALPLWQHLQCIKTKLNSCMARIPTIRAGPPSSVMTTTEVAHKLVVQMVSQSGNV